MDGFDSINTLSVVTLTQDEKLIQPFSTYHNNLNYPLSTRLKRSVLLSSLVQHLERAAPVARTAVMS